MSPAQQDPFEPLPDWARTIGELGVGSAILGIRRFNIMRRDLETSCPPVANLIDQGVEAVANAAEPASDQLAEALRAIEWVTPDPARDLVTASRRITEKLPDILRLAGLTPNRKPAQPSDT